MRSERVVVDGIELSYAHRAGRQPALVLIHGLGAAKESFAGAFACAALRERAVLAADLVGFGDSARPASFSYRLDEQARLLLCLIDALRIERFAVVAHSMGGIVALHLAQRAGSRLCGLLDAEGNLTVEDCTLSRVVARGDEESFVEGGFALLRDAIGGTFGVTDVALAAYLGQLARCDARAFHRSAAQTVAESEAGELLARLQALPCAKLYLYGERNRGRFAAEQQLRAAGVPLGFVPGAGHALMDENPAAFYEAVAELLG